MHENDCQASELIIRYIYRLKQPLRKTPQTPITGGQKSCSYVNMSKTKLNPDVKSI